MRRKTIFGMIFLVFISLIPLIPWYFLSPVRTLSLNYENITHSLGQITALVGMTMFAITFVLSTRIKIFEKMLGGLDKVYLVHSILGGCSFMLLLFHPILLVLKFIPSRFDLAAKYLLPGHGLSVDLGIIALSGMIILLAITFYVNIKYNYWKISHKFMGLFFMFAVLHIFLVRGTASRDYIFEGYYIYTVAVSTIGLFAFIYSLFFKSINPAFYNVDSIKNLNGIYDIELSPINEPLKFKAGQFGFFMFHNKKLSREFHPFSIASSSKDKSLRILIKSLGDFTAKLSSLQIGDKVSVEGPYGEFTIKNKSSDMLWISAGIGITPFIGMAKEIASDNGYLGNVSLYYCAKTKDDFVALDELKSISDSAVSKFNVISWCSTSDGRISLGDIKPINKEMDVYICGPVEFKDSMIKQLIKSGFSKEKIYAEKFDFR